MEVMEKQQEQFSLGDSLTDVVVAAAELANVRLRGELKSFTDKVAERLPKSSFAGLLLLPPLMMFAAYGLALNALVLSFTAMLPTWSKGSVDLLAHGFLFIAASIAAYIALRRIRLFFASFTN